jgi:putative heme-binding domain-containing protein
MITNPAILLLFAPIVAVTLTAQDAAKPIRGDAANGKALVTSTKCLDCHRIGDTGSRLGPDLSDVGDRKTPEQLQRAIVAPDEEVLPENRSVRVVTRAGATVTGRLLNQDAFSVQLIDAGEQLKSYAKSDLRELTILEKGLMPSYEGQLNAQQIADLVRYLASLKGDPK